MNWNDFISQLGEDEFGTNYLLKAPANDSLIAQISDNFRLSELHPELEELYRQTNGILERNQRIVIADLVWPVEKLLEINREYRESVDFRDIYMSFDQLLFFSDAGNGDLFACISPNGRFDRLDIFTWDHETDSRTWIAPSLATFVEWWTSGKIKV